ncbi:MAG: UDP-glucose/GDP-mannose dehydrogenase family protein [Gammaproteobacteria bacterium]|nr:UDP-glucose/GDP-mannose dehydrogenase family protein [Gammaproteobacteria bacterium]
MKVCVLGLWHLGSVTAAGLAEVGHQVIGLDFDAATVAGLRTGVAPVFEPELGELLARGLSSGRLRFAARLDELEDIDVLWVTYDTPVDDDDNADTNFVMAQIGRALPALNADTLLLVSSQLPVGSMRRLQETAGAARPVACCPENLRLGRAVNDFLHPERIVVGVRSAQDRQRLHDLLSVITASIEWMSIESAEMTKHAINAFLATSVVFANEIASLCESVGADAREVERGLKSDGRIGPRAYLSPGSAFSGGTLARDVAFLNKTSLERRVTTPLLSSVLPSNELHKCWVQKNLQMLFNDLSRITVAVWGLAYKPGTDTLRRSMAVELCDWMISAGVTVRVHDPMVKDLPHRWEGIVTRCSEAVAAARGVDALVVATEWPLYQTLSVAQLTGNSDHLVVLDANRFLPELAADALHRLQYLAVGMPRTDG